MAVANIPVAPRNHLTGYTGYRHYSYKFNFDYYTLFHEGGGFTNEGEPIADGYEFEKRVYDVFEYIFNK